MEDEVQLPASPPRALSAGPPYSPITPEIEDRHRIGEDQEWSRNQSDKHGQIEDIANGQIPAEGAVPALDGMEAMDISEKMRLGDHIAQDMQTQAPDPSIIQYATTADALPAHDQDPFARAKAAFQELDQPEDDPEAMMLPLTDDIAFVDSTTSVGDSEPNRIRAFAKLEFDDGQFYMNTYSIEIGRDKAAARAAEQRAMQEHDRKESESKSKEGSNPDLERASHKWKQDAGMSAAASVASGGIMHMGDGEEKLRRRRKRGKSASSSGKGLSRHNSMSGARKTDYQALANASLVDQRAARPVDLTNMMPSPDECPLIPIHPPPNAEGAFTGHKGISRKHVRIAYNHERGLFELHVLGRNGCFVDGMHTDRGSVIALTSGTEIQIGGVSVRFLLPNVPDGETGTDLRSDAVSQSAYSFDFEHGMGEDSDVESNPETPTTDDEDDRYRELRRQQKAEAMISDEDEMVDEERDIDGDVDEDEAEAVDLVQSGKAPRTAKKAAKAGKHKSKNPHQDITKPKILLRMKLNNREAPQEESEAQPKRKGPGRPPKNGVMSKREEAEIRRREKEAAKAKQKGEIQVKEEELADAEELPSPSEKRKHSKKKKPEEKPEDAVEEPVNTAPSVNDVVESIENTETEPPAEGQQSAPPKPAKEKRPPKPPRSPSPVWDEATLTPEQLAKPTQSYVVLIHEALSNHPEGRMSLPQIYRAIERKYPYYKLRVQTVGWQSSVRHNLSQHPAFVKIERDGKGWMWGLDKNVSIEREKKRRPSPPLIQSPNMYPPGPNMYTRPYQNGFMGGPNGQMPPHNPYAMWPNNNPPPGRGYPPPNGLQRPPYPGPQGAQQPPGSYQSPYDSGRSQQQQGPLGPSNPLNHSSNQIPQMPPPYLNQARPSPNTPLPQQGQPVAQSPQPNQASLSQAQGQQAAPPSQSSQHPPAGSQQQGQQQQQPNQQPAVSSQTPAFSSTSGPAANNAYGIPSHIQAATQRFRGIMIENLRKSHPEADVIVSQAVNKCLGIPAPPNAPYKEYAPEESIIKALAGMLKNKLGWPADEKIIFAMRQGPAPSATASTIAPVAGAPAAGAGTGLGPSAGHVAQPNPVSTPPSLSTAPEVQAPPPAGLSTVQADSVAPHVANGVLSKNGTPTSASQQGISTSPPPLPAPQAHQDQGLKRPRSNSGINAEIGDDHESEEPAAKRVAQ